LIWSIMLPPTQEVIKMCEHKLKTEVDGRFAYQVCDTCNEVLNVIFLDAAKLEDDWEEDLVGL
jgi:hypothetical protein